MAGRRYRSDKRAEQAEGTRHAILGAAVELFERTGYRAATVAQIAARAGVSVNTIYASVGGKPHLLVALIDAAAADPATERAMSRVRAAVAGDEVVGAFAAGTRRVLQRHEWLLGQLHEQAAAEPQVRDVLAQPEAVFRRHVVAAAERLAELGELRAEVSSRRAADIIWFHFGFSPWRELREARWSWRDAEAWLRAQALHALIERPTAPLR